MPTDNFGPWTTSLTAGSRLELSAFWKGRLTRLSALSQIPTGRSGSGTTAVLCAGLMIGAAPILHSEAASFETGAADSKASVAATPAEPRPVLPISKHVLEALDKPTNVDFIDTPLPQVLQDLVKYHDIAIELDNAAVEKLAQIGNPRVTLQGEGITLRSILRLLSEPLTLGTDIDQEKLVVTTAEKLDRRLDDWSYDVGDLAKAGIEPHLLVSAITGSVAEDSWDTVGGPGKILIRDSELRVSQTRGVRAQIESLLAAVRRGLRGPRQQIDAEENLLVSRAHSMKGIRPAGVSDERTARWLRDHFLPPVWKEHGGEGTLDVRGDELIVVNTGWVHDALNRSLPIYFDDLKFEFRDRGPERLSDLTSHSYFWPVAHVPPGYGGSGVRLALSRIRTFEFRDVPLKEALNRIGIPDGLQFGFHSLELKDSSATQKSLVSLNANQQPLSRILDTLLEPLDLGWYVYDDNCGIVVTAKSEARNHVERLERRVYRVRELLSPGQNELSLRNRLAAEIAPEFWNTVGGPGTIQTLPGLLIVGAHHRIHDEIDHWLRSLEQKRK